MVFSAEKVRPKLSLTLIKEPYYLLQGTKVCQGIPNGARLKEKKGH
jgi:hypothetical protein